MGRSPFLTDIVGFGLPLECIRSQFEVLTESYDFCQFEVSTLR
jgi:hypothetical protein